MGLTRDAVSCRGVVGNGEATSHAQPRYALLRGVGSASDARCGRGTRRTAG